MPPSWAMAIARRASVTVSIAADTSGRFRVMFRESRVAREVSLGRTWENAGTSNTSSKVSAFPRRRMSELQKKRIVPARALHHESSKRSIVSVALAAPAQPCMAPGTAGPALFRAAAKARQWRFAVPGRYTCAMKLLRATLLGLACALPAAGFAQWQWIDKDGRKVFSDQSPPAEVPAKNILRQPGPKSRAAVTIETPAAAASAASAAQSAKAAPAVPKISGKDKELEEKKKQADAAEAEKKRESEEEIAKARADNCERAKRAKASFDSGDPHHPHEQQGRAGVPRRRRPGRGNQAARRHHRQRLQAGRRLALWRLLVPRVERTLSRKQSGRAHALLAKPFTTGNLGIHPQRTLNFQPIAIAHWLRPIAPFGPKARPAA